MAGFTSSMFRAVGFFGGRVMLSSFERNADRGIASNRKTLMTILEANKDTEFGRTHRFEALTRDPSGRAFREAVPLSRYTDYAESIARMERGETGVLTSDDLLFFAVSSGTTGRPKLVPTTKKHHGFTFKYMGTVVQGVISRHLHPSSSTDRGTHCEQESRQWWSTRVMVDTGMCVVVIVNGLVLVFIVDIIF